MSLWSRIRAQTWHQGLRPRVVALVSFAVLPIGLIAIAQTNRIATDAERNAELALLALSDQAVQSDRLIIQRATGAAEMLGSLVERMPDTSEGCRDTLQDFIARDGDFSFAGILPKTGLMTCSTVSQPLDFSNYPTWPDLVANPRPSVVFNNDAPGSGMPVIVVSMPYQIDGDFAGYASISVPRTRLADRDDVSNLPTEGLVELITFNDVGDLITAENNLDTASALLPLDVDLASVKRDAAHSFRSVSVSGEDLIYTVVPLVDSPITIMGIWSDTNATVSRLLPSRLAAFAFPVIMWAASVLVAVMTINTLVMRPIRRLQEEMIAFTDTRLMPDELTDPMISRELAVIQDRFETMTLDIMREEIRLENLLHEQKVLAKEVHHRVKNNLQMIASIMNMQIRSAEAPETVRTMQRVQDRITALAEVHHDLYTSERGGRINAGDLVRRTVQHTVEMGLPDLSKVNLVKEIEDVWLFPDQVVPLSLLAGEAITNALKYLGPQGDGPPLVSVTFRQVGDACELIVTNSVREGEVEGGTGVGAKLIRAFGVKLNGTPQITHQDGIHRLELTFPIAMFEAEPADF